MSLGPLAAFADGIDALFDAADRVTGTDSRAARPAPAVAWKGTGGNLVALAAPKPASSIIVTVTEAINEAGIKVWMVTAGAAGDAGKQVAICSTPELAARVKEAIHAAG